MVSLRDSSLQRLNNGTFDVLIVGGGINGAVSAAVLAGRGAKVALIDRGDFAGFTSQESSNLVWGGFKYLENYELLLVRKLCMSRNRLIKAYPDNIQPIGFLASARQIVAVSAVARGARAARPTGPSATSAPIDPRLLTPRDDRTRRAGDRHRRPYAAASSTTTPT